MIRQIKRHFAVKAYVHGLSQNLARRFSIRRFYTLTQVSHALQAGRFNPAFQAYAHALFCSQEDFDAHYAPLRLKCTYDNLRSAVGRRFFDGATDFDASDIIRATRRQPGDFHESGLGDPMA
jgi:hypothetical protein